MLFSGSSASPDFEYKLEFRESPVTTPFILLRKAMCLSFVGVLIGLKPSLSSKRSRVSHFLLS